MEPRVRPQPGIGQSRGLGSPGRANTYSKRTALRTPPFGTGFGLPGATWTSILADFRLRPHLRLQTARLPVSVAVAYMLPSHARCRQQANPRGAGACDSTVGSKAKTEDHCLINCFRFQGFLLWFVLGPGGPREAPGNPGKADGGLWGTSRGPPGPGSAFSKTHIFCRALVSGPERDE